jgi:serine/threonine-protein kinase HipA
MPDKKKTEQQQAHVQVCPSTLAVGFTTYSPVAIKSVFNNKKVSHVLPYETPQKNESVAEQFIENRKRISISGVQEKLSLLLDGKKLRLTKEGEQGTYILKPIPRDLKKVDQVPANEHLTMQIAKQVYGINVAENAMIFFKDGAPAYITKRFDVKADGLKWGKEDFATLAGKTKDNAGPDFKYDYSYEEIGSMFQKYVPSWRIEIEKYFTLVLFNYAFSNGDAHLKNFSLLETESGDYTMSPAYDLVNTCIHVDDTDFALNNKLFKDNFKSAHWKKTGQATSIDFIEFGKRIGVQEKRVTALMAPFLEVHQSVVALIDRSFLDEATKKTYVRHYQTKRNTLIK